MKKIVICGMSLALLSGCVVHVGSSGVDFSSSFDSSDSVKLNETLVLPANDITTLTIDARAGDVEIVGVKDLSEIRVNAEIRTSENTDHILTLDTKNTRENGAELYARPSRSYNSRGYSYIDLEVQVPSDINLNLLLSSGDLEVSGINGNVEISDSSGDIELKDIGGDIDIADRSGDIDISGAGADVSIIDSSGDIDIYDVVGEVTIDDGSGDIDVNTAESVNIISAGSGDTDFSNIKSHVHGVSNRTGRH